MILWHTFVLKCSAFLALPTVIDIEPLAFPGFFHLDAAAAVFIPAITPAGADVGVVVS
ncbi:MAG TPA: hypothetical protein VL026_11385 [Rhizomicrobium sp.]|nr:hypothetical protein [Rhizomicrobium sp.]